MKSTANSRTFIGVLLCILILTIVPAAGAYEFAFGADLSFLKQAEDHGAVFKDGTNAEPALQIFKNHGYNWIRLRLFVEPVDPRLPNDQAYTITLAQEAKALHYKFLLDLHYSSTWADPAHQITPAAWQNLTHRQRTRAVFAYTRDTIAAFRNAGVLPDMVQVGNEITPGMLWPDGRLPDHWNNLADYLRAGIKGVKAGSGTNASPRIMIHIDTGGSMAKTKYFFDIITHYHIPFDVIGLSYYPWWHGSIEDLRENLAFSAMTYGKDVIVDETAYHWQPNRETGGRTEGFPETPEGQRDFLDAVARTVMETPNNHGKGVFWWEPAVSPHSGLVSRSFFDDNGTALPVMSTFDKYTLPPPRTKN